MLLKLVASFGPSGSPTSEDSFSVVEIGVLTGLQEFMPALFTKSIAYFLRVNNIPSLILDISIPKKKWRPPRSLSANSFAKFLSNAMVAVWEELATMMLSTYTRINMVTSLLLRKKREVSRLEGVKLSYCNFILSLEYHALGAYFNPYIALSSLLT
jgi:hypothetical protein